MSYKVLWNSELCHPVNIGPDSTQLPPQHKMFLFNVVSRSILGSTLHPVQWETQAFLPGKWLGLQANLLPPSSKKIKNVHF